MPKTAQIYLRIDPQVKSDVEQIYAKYGLSLTDALTVFLYQSRNVGGLPFDLHPPMPNALTENAIEEGARILNNPETAHFQTVEDFVNEMGF